MLHCCLLILLFGFQTQTAPQTAPTPLPRGPIKGRVVTEDGETLSGITVTANPIGGGGNRPGRPGQGGGTFSQAMTDDEGNFLLDGLSPASYSLFAAAPGYITAPPDENSGANLYHPGEVVTLTLVKGGVITGKVYSQNGEALTGINVSATRIGGVNGEADNAPQTPGLRQSWRTDDQGEYRIYGLATGSYLIQAGGRNNAGGPGGFGPPGNGAFSEDAPTFYPSAVRDAATPVTVYAGAEASGIDIRYRNLRGYAVSGKVVADKSLNESAETSRRFAPTLITLNVPGTDTVVATSAQMPAGMPGPGGPRGGGALSNNGFAFYGIAEGEYEIVANRSNEEGDAATTPKRISVRGADLAGVELLLLPLASISGRLKFEKLALPNETACRLPRIPFLNETLLRAVSETAPPTSSPSQVFGGGLNFGARRVPPDAQGAFTLRGLRAGRYRLATELPAATWYVRNLQWDKPAPTPAATQATTTRKTATTQVSAPANQTRTNPVLADPVLNGLALKQGERATGLIVTVAEGAASLSGKAQAYQLVHLIPAEKESADDLLRYAQTYMQKDGTFRFTHLAPGKYWLLTQTAKPVERPLAWDAAQRLALRRAAETSGKLVELQPCQKNQIPEK